VETIGFIGSGNMAEALIRGLIAAKVYPAGRIWISDVRAERLNELAKRYGVLPATDNAELARGVGTIVLSVKPQIMKDALESIKDSVDPDVLVMSIAAGIKTSFIASILGDLAIVRVMPNTPALIGQGAAALFANEKARGRIEQALSICSAVGKAVVLDDEDLMDAVTALSGSGPAYFFLLMEAMSEAGTALGLPPDLAKDLTLQTAKGAGLLACEADRDGQHPAVLRRKVTSPGGTTEAALKVFDAGDFTGLVGRALTAARNRSRELSA
jgi:pyrroline-5-carboxylate reductase